MTQLALSLSEETIASARGSLYWLLSLAFKYPVAAIFDAYQRGAFFDDLHDRLAEAPHLQDAAVTLGDSEEAMRAYLDGLTLKDLQVAYTQIFDVGAPQPPCPPYEGIHRPGMERTVVLLQISELYKHFGLAMSEEEGKRELPDHLSAELQFMNFLTFKEAQAREEGTAELLHGYRLAQRDFLERRLHQWLPAFTTKLAQVAANPFYAGVAGLTLDLVRCDFDWVSAELAAEQPCESET